MQDFQCCLNYHWLGIAPGLSLVNVDANGGWSLELEDAVVMCHWLQERGMEYRVALPVVIFLADAIASPELRSIS